MIRSKGLLILMTIVGLQLIARVPSDLLYLTDSGITSTAPGTIADATEQTTTPADKTANTTEKTAIVQGRTAMVQGRTAIARKNIKTTEERTANDPGSVTNFAKRITTAVGNDSDAVRALETIMKDKQVVGLSVAVVKNNRIIFTKALGLKNIAGNIPLAENNLFRIASISKSFSATTIMKLAEAGKVSLTDDFSKLVGFSIRNPKYPEKVITLQMVLSHTSSINDSQGYFSLDAINPEKNPNAGKCYNDYEPGKGYQYCNLNYNLTGAVIEKISATRFDVFIRQQILQPLNLYGGYCIDSLDNTLFATLYEPDSASGSYKVAEDAYHPRREQISRYIMGQSTPVFSPTGGMKISAPDLARYMMMHMNYGKLDGVRIISRRSAKKMQRKIADEEGYGLAMTTVSNLIPGRTMKGHTGSAYGLYSAMFFDPKEKFGIVVITNGCDPGYRDGYNEVIRSSVNALYETLIKR